jgi:N-acyl-D-amino-acid deacylase
MTIDDIEDDVRTIVTWSRPHPEHAGKDLDEIAQAWNCTRREAAARLLPAGGVFFLMDEPDVQRILAYTHTMIGSDGLPNDPHPHPRLWGSFPRVLGHYARDLRLFSLEEAVRKMTSLPAAEFGLADRGRLQPGCYADLVIFDSATIADRARFDAPKQPAAGIDHVLVNGTTVWSDEAATGNRPGRVLDRAHP